MHHYTHAFQCNILKGWANGHRDTGSRIQEPGRHIYNSSIQFVNGEMFFFYFLVSSNDKNNDLCIFKSKLITYFFRKVSDMKILVIKSACKVYLYVQLAVFLILDLFSWQKQPKKFTFSIDWSTWQFFRWWVPVDWSFWPIPLPENLLPSDFCQKPIVLVV